jgi:M6 family metalloprotease-like protein
VCFLAAAAWAAPFAKYFHFTQPDGTQLTLWGEGDEFHAVFETTTGYTVVFDRQKQAYYYAERAADGKNLVPTGVLAHQVAPVGLAQHIRMAPDIAAAAAHARQVKWDEALGISKRWAQLKSLTLGTPSRVQSAGPLAAPPELPTVGTKIGLTLLIEFSDVRATIGREEIEKFCNSNNYIGFGNNGSVKEYFSDVSSGRLNYQNVVTMYVRMTQPKSYYDNPTKDCGEQGNLLIRDALAILKASPNYRDTILPTFDSLTVDANNWVVAFNVFYAGAVESGWSYGLWPHSYVLNDGVNYTPVDLGNGKKVCPYQISDIGTSLELGTFCHENGHMLCGFPDIYDYDVGLGESWGGAGVFCLMSYGSTANNPKQVCAYLKLAAGWATVTDLDSSMDLTASLVAAPDFGFDHFYRYRKPGSSTEYFLLENRQKAGRDAGLPAAGIAVWHIDELGDRDNESLVPNTAHANYEVTLVQADNQWHFQNNVNPGDANDLYYQGNGALGYANRLADSTAPNAHWWDGTVSSMDLNSFSSAGMTMTFLLGSGGGLSAPVLSAEPPVTPGTENTVYWSAVPGLYSSSSVAEPLLAESVAAKSVFFETQSKHLPQGFILPIASVTVGKVSPADASSEPAPRLPDLQPTSASWASATVTEGAPFWVRATVANVGTDAAGASHVALYLSADSDYDISDDYYVGKQLVGALNVRASQTVQWNFNMGDVSSGRYPVWLLLVIDCDNEIVESDEGNPWRTPSGFTIADAVEYYAECAADSGSPVGSGWTQQLQFTFSNLMPGKTYQYRVKARQGAVESGWSNVESSQQEPLHISGAVNYYAGAGKVHGVSVSLAGDQSQTVSTGTDGSYNFLVTAGGNYTITPSKNNDADPRAGVTTLDITLIRRHALVIELLASPYQIIAADVNGSGTVTALDVTHIMQLILDLEDTFPLGLWRFVPTDYEFSDPANPWTPPFPVIREYAQPTADLTDQSFFGIKLGDVNASWVSTMQAPELATPSFSESIGPGVRIYTDEQTGTMGDTVDVPIYAAGFQGITGLQFTLAWDPTILHFLSATNFGLKGLSTPNFNTGLNGKLPFAWDDPSASGVTVSNGTRLFSVQFKVVSSNPAVSPIAFENFPTTRLVGLGLQEVQPAWGGGRVMVRNGIQPRCSDIRSDQGGGFRITFSGMPGTTYSIQFCDSLVSSVWVTVGTRTADSLGFYEYLDNQVSTSACRFYRSIYP